MLPAFTYRRLQVLLMASTLLLALAHWYQFRHVIYADGISYLEIAERYSAGDWRDALNAYWSPLFSWLLVPVVRWLPGYWQVSAVHGLQVVLALAACGLSEKLWRRLTAGLEGLMPEQMPHARSWLVTRWCIYQWATLYLVGIHSVTPDMFALCVCLLVWLAVLDSRFVLAGVLLAVAFYTKTAFLLFAAATVFVALGLGYLRGQRKLLRGGVVMAALVAGLALPWALLLQYKTGRFTFGESGALNHAWFVGGVTRSIHWQGKEPGFGKPLHGTQQVSQTPDAFVWKPPFAASYAPWRDPYYFHQGLRNSVNLANQVHEIIGNATPLAWQLFSVPGSLAILAIVARFRKWKGILEDWSQLPLLLLPSAGLVVAYWLVYFETRHLAAPFLLLGSVTIFAVFRRAGDAARIFAIAAVAAAGVSLVPAMMAGLTNFSADLRAGRELSPNGYALLAQELQPRPGGTQIAQPISQSASHTASQAVSLPPGTKVAFVGFALHSDWARLAKVQIIGEVTARHLRDETVHRNLIEDFANVASFWSATPARREEIYQAFRKAGAEYVIVNMPAEDADLKGFQLLQTRLDSYQSDGRIWVKRLQAQPMEMTSNRRDGPLGTTR